MGLGHSRIYPDVTTMPRSEEASATAAVEGLQRRLRQARSDDNLRNGSTTRRRQKRANSEVSAEELEDDSEDDLGLPVRLNEYITGLDDDFHFLMGCLNFPVRARALRRQSMNQPNGQVPVVTEASDMLRGEEELLAEDVKDLVDLVKLQLQLEQFSHINRDAPADVQLAFKKTTEKLNQQACELEQAAMAPEMLQQLYEDVLCTSMDFMGFAACHTVLSFRYRQRRYEERAIHIAALHGDGMQLLNRLSLLGIDVGQECNFCTYGVHTGAAQALHLAAGCGNHDVIRELIRHNVDIDVKTKLQCRKNYTALHAATFFQLYSTVELLLRLKACPNQQDLHGLTPLHFVAKNGNHQIAKILLLAGADIRYVSAQQFTPLEVAIAKGRFPNQKLHYLAMRSIDSVVLVARLSPMVVPDLMRDTSSNSKNRAVHPSWREAFMREHVATETWLDLLKFAPQAAEDVLDAVMSVPYVENKNHHPLPRMAFLRSRQILRSQYTHEEKWSFGVPPGVPPWHWELAPMLPHNSWHGRERKSVARGLYELFRSFFHGNDALIPVTIKIVRLSGLISIQVLHALATTPYVRLFRKVAARAIVDHVWNEVVVWAYVAQVFYRVFELLLLALDVHNWRYCDDLWYRAAAWSLLAVSALRDTYYEVSKIIGVMMYLRKRDEYEDPLDVARSALRALLSNYLSDLKNVFDILSVYMLGVLLFFAACSGTNPDSMLRVYENKATLAFVVSCRWFQLLYTFRAFKFMAFWPLKMILITVFMFVGFWHAFLALSDNPGDGSVLYASFVPTFRFLFLGDGDGIDQAQDWLEPSGHASAALGLIACTIVFSVWILNLFIALISEAYDHAKELVKTTFPQERAHICFEYLLRPAFHKCPLGKLTRWRPLFFAGVPAVTLLIWLFLLRAVAHFVDGSLFGLLMLLLPTVLLLALVLLGDALLMTPPLQDTLSKDDGGPKYLWVCHHADYDEAQFWPLEELSTGQMSVTLTGSMHDSRVRIQRVHDEISFFKHKQNSFEVNINSRFTRLEQRMETFFSKLATALPNNGMDGVSQDDNYMSLSPSSGGITSPGRRMKARSRAPSSVSSLLGGADSLTPSEVGNDPNGLQLGGGVVPAVKSSEEPLPVPPPAIAEAIPQRPGTAPPALSVIEPMGFKELLPAQAPQSGGLAAAPIDAEATPEGGVLSVMQPDPRQRVAEALDNGLEGQAPSRGNSSPSTEIIPRLD